MDDAGAIAQVTGNQQGGQAGTDGDDDGEREEGRLVVNHRIGSQGGHAHVVHDRNAQADPHRGLQVLPEFQLRVAEGVHGQPRGGQGK